MSTTLPVIARFRSGVCAKSGSALDELLFRVKSVAGNCLTRPRGRDDRFELRPARCLTGSHRRSKYWDRICLCCCQSVRMDVPIVMASGYLRQEDQDMAARIGIRALFPKPNTMEEFGRLLQDLLETVRRESEK